MPRLVRRRPRTAAMAAALGVYVAPAVAEEPDGAQRYQLRWVREGGAESCVSGAALARWLDQTLHEARAGTEPVLLEGSVAPAALPLRYVARISVRDVVSGELIGERELGTAEASCSALTPSVLLVLAMSVDPEAAQAGLPQAVTDELRRGREEDLDVWPPAPLVTAKATRAEPAYTSPPPAARGPAVAEAPARRGSVVVGAALSSGIQPDWAPGVQLGADFRLWHSWSLSLSLSGWMPTTVQPRDSYYLLDGGVNFYAVGAVPALCRQLAGRQLRLDACGGAHLGLRWLRAQALQKQGNPVRTFVAPSLGVRGTWRLTPTWLVQASAALDFELDDQRFVYRDHQGEVQPLFDPGLVLARGFLGVGAAL